MEIRYSIPFSFKTLKTKVNLTQNLTTLLINLPELEIYHISVKKDDLKDRSPEKIQIFW
jgi:hypothetical protein